MLVVLALAAFVGVSIARAPRSTAASRGAVPPDIAARAIVRDIPPPREPPNTDSIAAKIAATPGTYLGDMIEEQGNRVMRWPDTTRLPIRVWVQAAPALRDWNDANAQMARDALAEWETSGIPLHFDFIFDSATADIRMEWTDQFPAAEGARVGLTTLTYDQYGWIVGATVTATLLEAPKRNKPWRATITLRSGRSLSGPIEPVERTPADAAAGRAVPLVVAHVDEKSVRFTWPA